MRPPSLSLLHAPRDHPDNGPRAGRDGRKGFVREARAGKRPRCSGAHQAPDSNAGTCVANFQQLYIVTESPGRIARSASARGLPLLRRRSGGEVASLSATTARACSTDAIAVCRDQRSRILGGMLRSPLVCDVCRWLPDGDLCRRPLWQRDGCRPLFGQARLKSRADLALGRTA